MHDGKETETQTETQTTEAVLMQLCKKSVGIILSKFLEVMNDWTRLDHALNAVVVYRQLLKESTPGERMHTHYTKRLQMSLADVDKELANGNLPIPS